MLVTQANGQACAHKTAYKWSVRLNIEWICACVVCAAQSGGMNSSVKTGFIFVVDRLHINSLESHLQRNERQTKKEPLFAAAFERQSNNKMQ